MTPDPMNPVVMPPATSTLVTYGSMGGLARVNYTMLDGERVVFMVNTNQGDAGRFAMDPTVAKLFDDDDTIDFSALDNDNAGGDGIKAGSAPTAVATTGPTSKTIGFRYLPSESPGTPARTVVYIDARAPVVMAYEDNAGTNLLEYTVIGGLPGSSLPTGQYDYQGFGGFSRAIGATSLHSTFNFDMTVDFDRGQVTKFEAANAMEGTVRLTSNLPTVNAMDGSFEGVVGFTAGSSGTSGVVPLTFNNGRIHGQFHGDQAIGVTGGFDNNSVTRVVGAFAGARDSE